MLTNLLILVLSFLGLNQQAGASSKPSPDNKPGTEIPKPTSYDSKGAGKACRRWLEPQLKFAESSISFCFFSCKKIRPMITNIIIVLLAVIGISDSELIFRPAKDAKPEIDVPSPRAMT